MSPAKEENVKGFECTASNIHGVASETFEMTFRGAFSFLDLAISYDADIRCTDWCNIAIY